MTALILHGGAGARRERNYDAEVVHMRQVVEAMKARLDAGASAVDVAVEAVVMLEDSGLYVAGRGASPNLAGAYELQLVAAQQAMVLPQVNRPWLCSIRKLLSPRSACKRAFSSWFSATPS